MKHKIKVPEEFRSSLANLPESGMGSQKVDVILKDGRVIKAVSVFNAEDALSEVPFNPEEILTFKLSDQRSE